jgi:hypothetical protein
MAFVVKTAARPAFGGTKGHEGGDAVGGDSACAVHEGMVLASLDPNIQGVLKIDGVMSRME